jgi:release factor glutamine methyltransferase
MAETAVRGPRGGLRPGSVGATLAEAAQALTATSDTPRLDAELLLASALGADRARLIIDRDEPVAADALPRFRALVDRRAHHEPVAYLLGRRAFRHLVLTLDPRVLIPRPETELLVEVGLSLPAGASVVDVGTGSGAVALALKDERPDLQIAGVDMSAEAIAVARANASRLSLDVSFSVGDLLAGVQPVDAVLANLPYVQDGAALPSDVADFEPPSALFGGPDGLDLVRRLVPQACPQAELLALEIAPAQAAEVTTLMRAAGFARVEVLPDLAGRERVVVGRRLP